MNRKLRISIPVVCVVIACTMSACQRRAAAPDNAGVQPKSATVPIPQTGQVPQAGQVSNHGAHVTNTNDASLIPSVNSVKVRTTNEHGGTSYGLGSSVYSMIGSSSLHSNGFSSHLESRLSGEGIDGVKVFVVDDVAILATEKRQTTGSQYDEMQQKVLSYSGGQSGHGPEPARPPGTTGSSKMSDDNLDKAASRIKEMMGGNVKVLTVVGPQAVETINRLRTKAADQSTSAQTMSEDIRRLLELAMANKK